jgi:hypothetical protein
VVGREYAELKFIALGGVGSGIFVSRFQFVPPRAGVVVWCFQKVLLTIILGLLHITINFQASAPSS